MSLSSGMMGDGSEGKSLSILKSIFSKQRHLQSATFYSDRDQLSNINQISEKTTKVALALI